MTNGIETLVFLSEADRATKRRRPLERNRVPVRIASKTFEERIGDLLQAGLEALSTDPEDAALLIATACRALRTGAARETTTEPAVGHVRLCGRLAPQRVMRKKVHSDPKGLLEAQEPCGEIRSASGRPISKGLGNGTHTHSERGRPESIQEQLDKLRQLESDLAHMNRLSVMGELTATLAHEIAQPMAAARNNSCAAIRFLKEPAFDAVKVRQALLCVVDDVDRAADIIDRIRDHIRKAPPRRSSLDLGETIGEVIELARGSIAQNEVSLQIQLIGHTGPVHGDRIQLQQVMLNLILNAVEAMSSTDVKPRELLISVEPHESGSVIVGVRDSGPGIDHECLERIFEPFYTTKNNGTGMGLSICRSIIVSHGGRLWAEPNAPRGAALWFTLPGRTSTESFPFPFSG